MSKNEVAVLAGGCFWCTEAVFQRLKGVELVKPGFSGGHIKNPAYKEVITQSTGHAEVSYITFNPSELSFNRLLEVFFATHDPTTLNRQGGDVGTHYRSAIFYTTENQQKTANEFIEILTKEKVFKDPIVTEVTAFDAFYEAEDYHSDYYNQNSEQSFCKMVINPKIEKLEKYFKDDLM